jgi:hypothetical protein
MLIITNSEGRKFAVVLVKNGDRYGRDFCLTNAPGQSLSDGRTLVEFWDLTYKHGPVRPDSPVLGQFVSRYHLTVLLGIDASTWGVTYGGLRLDGGIPEWTIDAGAMLEVRNWLAAVYDRETALAV